MLMKSQMVYIKIQYCKKLCKSIKEKTIKK